MSTQTICSDLARRQTVSGNPALNGIDFLEVLDLQALDLSTQAAPSPRQQTLLVRLFQPVPPLQLQNIRIEGGVRITPINVVWAFPAGTLVAGVMQPGVPSPPATHNEQAFFAGLPNPDHVLVIRTNVAGDFSTYTLRLVQSPANDSPPGNFDVRFAAIDFSFKVECPSDFDCQAVDVCSPQAPLPAPQIDYLAKDYSSFRMLMLDRLATTLPDWQEQSAADIGIALVDVLAFAGDRLSYRQDAVATEAYLGTARKRVSVRRHARLLDYAMHDGVNARVCVHIGVSSAADGTALPGPLAPTATVPGRPGTTVFTQVNAARGTFSGQMSTALDQGAVVFQTLHDITLRAAHNKIQFYTWGDDACCLPQGATQASLRKVFDKTVDPQDDGSTGPVQLKTGDALVFEEVLGPATGVAADADPAHRWVVRLTSVTETKDALTNADVVEIEWSADDALPFPLCVSTNSQQDVSVARGNLVLADHGQSITGEALNFDDPDNFQAGRFRPRLQNTRLTFTTPYNPNRPAPFNSLLPASASLTQDPRAALPAITLAAPDGTLWTPLPDLLEAGPFAPNFVVETEEDGTATLRFGDDTLGAKPTAGFIANYRIGNGNVGHVGAEAIAHLVLPALNSPPPTSILRVRNPLASQGGIDPESSDEVRLYAPQAFRTQERAVTVQDYADAAEGHPQVEKAESTLRFTGTWHTVSVTVQRRGGQAVDDAFRADVTTFLEPLRMAGFDLEVEAPIFVPLDIALTIHVAPGYFSDRVEQALLTAFSDGNLPDGSRGFFHPDNFTFGQPVYLSRIVAAAMQVPGVLWVDSSNTVPNRFQRFGELPHGELQAGKIEMERLEIARLDNDPNEPENGRLQFIMEDGA